MPSAQYSVREPVENRLAVVFEVRIDTGESKNNCRGIVAQVFDILVAVENTRFTHAFGDCFRFTSTVRYEPLCTMQIPVVAEIIERLDFSVSACLR